MADRRLYQSFPRTIEGSRCEENEQVESGLAILAFLIDFGLLLTPEVKRIGPNPLAELRPPPVTTIVQTRSCFTALTREELFRPNETGYSHARMFGPITVGLSARAAITLGMMPTVYLPVGHAGAIPTETSARVSNGGLGQDLLYKLADIRHLLIAVARIEATAHPSLKKDYLDKPELDLRNLMIPENDRTFGPLNKLKKEDALKAFRLLDTDRTPAFILAEFIEIVLSNFQQVDSFDNEAFGFYDQREWRIVNTASEGFECYPLGSKFSHLWPIQIRMLLELAKSVTQASAHKLGNRLNLEDCALVRSVNGRSYFDFIQEIVVPHAIGDAVRSLLAGRGVQGFVQAELSGVSDYTMFSR
ncbi:MAG: hypothetical protein SGJ21_13925 [Alphaproteobacteria bacterium]|nr:hypothetical protein [Alphaproteobacteria bacterium]